MLQGDEVMCHAVVRSIGEMFGEFGFAFDQRHLANDVSQVTKWNLYLELEDEVSRDATLVLNEEMPVEKAHKVVKLQAGRFYRARVRVFSEIASTWGPWSNTVRTATLHAVRAHITDIGEDYVSVQWNRPQRNTHDTVEEVNAEVTKALSDISDMELRLLRKSDMRKEFEDRFDVGVRAYTINGLYPGTSYVAMIRYRTLINTMKNWTEIGCFFTRPPYLFSLVSRGEDAITVNWYLAPSPVDAVGCIVPDTVVDQYELLVEGEDSSRSSLDLPATQHEHRFVGLSPGTLYMFYVRSLTIEGRWGRRSEAFKVRTADRPELSVVALGETFFSFTWTRPNEEPMECKAEFCLTALTLSSRQKPQQQQVIEIGPHAEDKVIHLQDLTADTDYSVTLRTFLQGEWGVWTEPWRFRTHPKATLTFLERGENFFTLSFEKKGDETPLTLRFNLKVTHIAKNDERCVVFDEDVVSELDDAGFRVGSLLSDTEYEVSCRSWQHNRFTGYEGWGEFSAPVRTRTLRKLALQVCDVGENFLQLAWQRGLSDTQLSCDVPDQKWLDLKYEIVVGCVNTGEDKIVHQQVLKRNYVIANLSPATTYIVSVRACNEFDQWGLWSTVRVRTLASVTTSVYEIGEDYLSLMWQRQSIEDENDGVCTARSTDDFDIKKSANSSKDFVGGGCSVDGNGSISVTTADMFVSRYAVFVCSQEDGESTPSTLSGYHMGGNSEVARYEVVTGEHTSMRVDKLLPDREYVAVVRASTVTGKWGLWSRPLRFRTNPQFRIPVNNLTIGENYVNLLWSRDEHPLSDKDVFFGDLTVTGQQLRIHGVDTPFSKDHTLPVDMRELKIYGLSPATAYTIQIRVCGKSGNWGLWTPPVHILTRDTILTKAVEVAEDYIIIAWERRKAINPKNYITGRGGVMSYHLRVYNNAGVHSEEFLCDSDTPYRIPNLIPDTYYCVEMKANYDGEWALWSTPLWCLTMKSLEIQATLISEEFCRIIIRRPNQQKRLPEDDGNRATDDRVIAFGQFRPTLILCITSPTYAPTPHISNGNVKPRPKNSSLPPNAVDHRLIYQTEILCTTNETEYTIPNLRSNTVYSASARSKLTNGEWGIWSQTPLLFVTVSLTQVEFTDSGETFLSLCWKRSPQVIPPQIEDPSKIYCGVGAIAASRVKVREIGGSFQKVFELSNSLTSLRVDSLSPASTYAVSVQTYNDNYKWGTWSEEGKAHTIPGMEVVIHHISEDAVWAAWARRSDVKYPVGLDVALNVDVVAKAFEIRIVDDNHFSFTKEMNSNSIFFRGLKPDTMYSFQVRAQSLENQQWGVWSAQSFRTKPQLRVTFGNVGEHFAIVEWRRHLPALLNRSDSDTVVESEDVVQQFRLKVMRVGDKVPYVYDLSPYISSFRLKDLLPSAEYRVWLCAKGYEGVWGFWNDEARVCTLPKMELEVIAIGETYVTVSWKRGKWVGETGSDGSTSVREMDGAVSGYEVRVLDASGAVVTSQSLSFHETSCTLQLLELSTVYSVEVSAKDTYEEWGFWSDAKRFVTLGAVDLRVLMLGETFAELDWGRRRCRRRCIGERKNSGTLSIVSENENDATDSSSNLPDEERSRDEEKDGVTSGNDKQQRIKKGRGDEENRKWSDYADYYYCGNNDDDDADDDYDDDNENSDGALLYGDYDVLQWHLRIEGQCLFGGQPNAKEFMEFYIHADEVRRVVDSLLPNTTYTVSVRAQDRSGAWGYWSQTHRLVTYPLLALSAHMVTETFIHVSWARPPAAQTVTEGFVCFPPVSDIHNYQVKISPLRTEEPFKEEEEPLVNGARVYETSQPSLRLLNLTPGVRYRVAVREQAIGADGGFVSDTWGSFSSMVVVEMVQAMNVVPAEIGEDYCVLSWHRIQRPPDTMSEISVVTSQMKVIAYELQAVRLDDKALHRYTGPLALDTILPMEASRTSYHLGSLVSNTIYAVSVRAQLEGGYWGSWSRVTKFVSQSRLQMSVHAVYEDNVQVSWSRPLPHWAMLQIAASDVTECEESQKEIKQISDPVYAPAVAAIEETEKEIDNDLGAVLLGDYSIYLYELHVEGVTCNMRECIALPKEQMSTRVTGLMRNEIYTVCVRSQSAEKHWSMFSRRESILTLSAMCVEVSHCTENAALIRWFRAPQSISDFEDFLHKRCVEEEQQCERRERQDLFELKRRLQELDDTKEKKKLSDYLALRHEHNAVLRMDATHHLKSENVVLGDARVSGFQLRFRGAGCIPSIPGLNHMLLQFPQRLSSRGRRQDEARCTSSSKRSQKRVIGEDLDASEKTLKKGAVEEGIGQEDMPLIDVQLLAGIMSVVVTDLRPSTQFSVEVRARNTPGEWSPWSMQDKFTTLDPIELHQHRFGEHYIHLYWHRLPQELATSIESDKQRLRELNEEFISMSPKDLEDKKKELSDEDYNVLVERLKSWRDLKRSLSNMQERLAEGHGEVVVHSKTPIKGYRLRVIHENGTFIDYHIDNKDKDEADAILSSYTVTGLVSNTMYVALLCCDYGFHCGPWTEPLKFVTQNLLQLLITYISETFVDIEWHRAPNKRLPPMDQGAMLASDAVSMDGRIFQVRITWEGDDIEKDGSHEEKEELRTMRSCSVFRVDKLLTDTKYTLAVCEWDSQGDWGLWCIPKMCVTLPGMSTRVEELGEDWSRVTWFRNERRVDYDDEIHVLQYSMDTVSAYLMVKELLDNGLEGDEWVVPSEVIDEGGNAETAALDEMEGIFTAERQLHGPLPPQEHPLEFEGECDGRMHLVRRFSKETSSFLLKGLRPDRFYSVQVLCETTGGQLGAWSPEGYFLTMSKIKIKAARIEEEHVDLSWERPPPRSHPRIQACQVFRGHYTTTAYVLEVRKIDEGGKNFQLREQLDGSDNTSYHLVGLTLDTVYDAKVRSINDEGSQSMWSDVLCFVTLSRIVVQPMQITEHTVALEWGRKEQRPTRGKGGESTKYDNTICVGSDNTDVYVLRVSCGGTLGTKLMFEKSFTGDIRGFHLTGLTPNTPYVVCVRAANDLGEWSLWSEDRCVYTMKLIHTDVVAVGEDYIRISWARDDPDELRLVDPPLHFTRLSFMYESSAPVVEDLGAFQCGNDGSIDNENEGSNTIIGSERGDQLIMGTVSTSNRSTEAATTALSTDASRRASQRSQKQSTICKMYPLLDRPEKKSAVYNSLKTQIVKYAVTVSCGSEDEDNGYTIEVSGEETILTVSSLQHDTCYSLAVRACYGSGEWGVRSPFVSSGTLNIFTVEVSGLGEDYINAVWRRLPNTYDMAGVSLGIIEDTLGYELAVYDFTDVSFGEEDAEELSSRLHGTVLVSAKSRSCTAKDLLSNHRYRVSVRRWYKPSEAFAPVFPVVLPNTDDEEMMSLMRQNNALSGVWSDGVYGVTLRDMVCTVVEIAEEFFTFRWERDPCAAPLLLHQPFAAKPTEIYHVRIDEMTPDRTSIDTKSSSLHVNESLGADESMYVLQGVRSDTVYRVEVRCRVDNAWGRWSRAIHIMTMPKLVVNIGTIGEDYVTFSWQRPRHSLLMPDGTEAFGGNDEQLSRFHLEVVGFEQSFHLSKKFKASRTTYRVRQLEPNTVYSVCVRSYDLRRNAWSPWSDRALFATLKPMRIVVSPAGEHFVSVEWYREEQTPEEYNSTLGDNTALTSTSAIATANSTPLLGNPEVVAYHLCVFSGQQAPSLAVVDKQFPKDVTRYHIGSLTAETSYVVVVRACNAELHWGLWSKEGAFRTRPVIKLCVTAVGENYAMLKWKRDEGESADDIRVPGICAKAEPIAYQLLVKAGTDVLEHVIQKGDCLVNPDEQETWKYVLHGLNPETSYLMAMQPCYEENLWGLWTPTVKFNTVAQTVVTVNGFSSESLELSFSRKSLVPLLETVADATASPSPATEVTGTINTSPDVSFTRVSAADTSASASAAISIAAAAAAADAGDATAPDSGNGEAYHEPQPSIVKVTCYHLVVRKTDELLAANESHKRDVANVTISSIASPSPTDAVFIATTNEYNDGNDVAASAADADTEVAISASGETVAACSWEERDSESPVKEFVTGDQRDGGSPLPLQKEPFVLEREVEVLDDETLPNICEVNGLESGTSYTIQVRSLDVNGLWGLWTELVVETSPLPPRNVALYRLNAQFGILHWEPPDERCLYRYVVEQLFPSIEGHGKSKGVPEWRVTDSVEETSCRIRFTMPIRKMRCRVKSVKIGDNHPFSEFCDPVSLSSGKPPEPASNLIVTSLARGSIGLEWTEPQVGAHSPRQPRSSVYRVYLGVLNHTPILLTTLRGSSYTIEDLEPSTEYTIQIVAENADGISYNNPSIRVVTKSEEDETVSWHDPEQAPLGTIVGPLSAIRHVKLPEIPSARQMLVPQPPSKRGSSRGRGKKSLPGIAPSPSAAATSSTANTSARAASLKGSMGPLGAGPANPSRDGSAKRKVSRLPPVKKQH